MTGEKRTIAIIVLFMNNFGKKGFYQSQEFGLADAFAKAGYDVDVYKCSDEPDRTEDNSYPVYYTQVKRFGTHALFRPEQFFRRRYDVIIAFSDTQLIVPRLDRYCRKEGIVFIPYVGNTESVAFSMKTKKRMMDFMFRRTALRTYRRCGTVFCKSYDTIRQLTSMGVSAQRLVFAPVGINLSMLNDAFRPDDAKRLREEAGYDAEDRILLFVGRMNHEKRPLDMFRIMEKLEDDHVKLIMIGDGILVEQVEHLAGAFPGRVRYLRQVPYEHMWEYYVMADCFVNLWDQEIFGMAIAEAVYYMTPAFLIFAPGPEVIAEGLENAFLCGSIDEIVERIKTYRYDEESLRRDREHLIENCCWDRFVEALEGLKL